MRSCVNLSSCLRASISKVLVMMNKEQISAALVVDEYGGTAGLLTMEDIMEEVLGDFKRRAREVDQHYKKINETSINSKADTI